MLIGYIQFRFEDDSKYFAKSTVMPKYIFHLINIMIEFDWLNLTCEGFKINCKKLYLTEKQVCRQDLRVSSS